MSEPSRMLHSSSASNWVDRGDAADRKVRQIVAQFIGDADAAKSRAPWLTDAVRDLGGMVLADASEVQLAGYLRTLAESRGRAVMDAPPALLVAVAVWHIVKAAEVRDRAERIIRTMADDRPEASPPLAEWLAERLLSPDELQAHRRQRAADDVRD